jgi:hypothetical protein
MGAEGLLVGVAADVMLVGRRALGHRARTLSRHCKDSRTLSAAQVRSCAMCRRVSLGCVP